MQGYRQDTKHQERIKVPVVSLTNDRRDEGAVVVEAPDTSFEGRIMFGSCRPLDQARRAERLFVQTVAPREVHDLRRAVVVGADDACVGRRVGRRRRDSPTPHTPSK